MGCGDCCIPPKESREPIRYDPDFNGPVHSRSCTDIFWLIIFIAFLGVWGFVGYYSMKTGSVEKLLAPMDSQGHRCGLDAGYEKKKYLLFFDISRCLDPRTAITGCNTPQVCVEKCPVQTMFFNLLDAGSFETVRSNMACSHEINIQTMSFENAKKYINNEKCAPYVLQSQPVLGRCTLDLMLNLTEIKNIIEKISEAASSPFSTDPETFRQMHKKLAEFDKLSSQIAHDLNQSRWYLVGALAAVVVLCFAYILLLRWVVAPVVWTSILGLIGLLGFGLYQCYVNYKYYKENPVILLQTSNLKGYVESWVYEANTWLVLMIALAVIMVILLLIVIFLRKRITIAIALIKEGSKAVIDIKSTVIFPIFPWLLQCAVIAYAITVLMFILSIGEPAFKAVQIKNDTDCECTINENEGCDPVTFLNKCWSRSGGRLTACPLATCHFTGLENPFNVYYLHFVNTLGFFWAMFFISGVADMMLASTFSTWYWTFRKRDLPFFTLTSGITRVLFYHLGTVALGSLIIAIVRVIRVILEYIDHKLKKFDNPFTRCIMCCCKCAFWCLENFLKFINKNAFIMCAVHGKNFCSSARDAFSLLMRNIVRVVVLDKVMDFIFFLSKLLISISVGIAVYYMQNWNLVYEVTRGERLHYNYVPAIILSIATYLVSTVFFKVYAMAVDTLFLCFLEDCERNDGSTEKPYYMSSNLKKILGKSNRRK